MLLPQLAAARHEPPLVARLKRALPARAAVDARTAGARGRRSWPCRSRRRRVALPFLGEEFLPNFKENDFLMHWVEKPGTSLEAMARITVQAARSCGDSRRAQFRRPTSAAPRSPTKSSAPNFTELWISLDPSVDYEATVAKVQEVVDGYPGCTATCSPICASGSRRCSPAPARRSSSASTAPTSTGSSQQAAKVERGHRGRSRASPT